MTARKKRLGLALAVGLVALGGMIWWSIRVGEPGQLITMPSGEKFRFVGVTYGKENVPPSLLARLVHSLPKGARNWLESKSSIRDRISQFNAGEKYEHPKLIVWFKHVKTNRGKLGSSGISNPTAVLADSEGHLAGTQVYSVIGDDMTWGYAAFSTVPKRSRTLTCQIYAGGYAGDKQISKVTFSNPLFGHFRDWQPEPLPATTNVGDLAVRLDGLRWGNPAAIGKRPTGAYMMKMKKPIGGETIATQFDYSLQSARGTNERWVLQSMELSDATGNSINGRGQLSKWPFYTGPPTDAGWYGGNDSVPGSLWPNESAWRLKLELKRSFGFEPSDLVTFRNVPVPAPDKTGTQRFTNFAHGLPFVLEPIRRSGINNGVTVRPLQWTVEIEVKLPAQTNGTAFDMLRMTTDTVTPELNGIAYGTGEVFPDSTYRLEFLSLPTNTTTADITFVFQKTRTAAFFFKPPNGGEN